MNAGPAHPGNALFIKGGNPPAINNGVHLKTNRFRTGCLFAKLYPALLTAARQYFTAIRRFHPFPESTFALTFPLGWMICHLHRYCPSLQSASKYHFSLFCQATGGVYTHCVNDTFYIKGVRILDPAAGIDAIRDLFIENGHILAVPSPLPPGTRVIDGYGLSAAPGFMDLHVHLREPGHEIAETVATGCLSAARGGFTTIIAMPNTNPPLDLATEVQALDARARAANLVHVLPAPCITRGRAGREVADLASLDRAGAVAFTDDGCTVSDDAVMETAMRIAAALHRPVMDHALSPKLAGHGVMHEGHYSKQLGLPGIPSEAETVIVDRDIQLSRKTGCAVHIQHLSAAGSVELIRAARKDGLPVTAELTPHHLALTDAHVDPARPECHKMNPPVRSEADREALVRGLLDGTISCFATDHAPHTAATKANGFKTAPFGVVGLETAVGVTYTLLVKKGLMSALDWVARWTTGPAGILGRPAPTLAKGAPADVVLLDLDSEWVVNAAKFASKSRNTPFDGWRLTGRAVMTFCGGRLVFDLKSEILNLISRQNIVLMGFMGTGKSTVGKKLAKRLGLTFVDMDTLIEERAGKPIPRIFAEEGEPRFRAMERELARELSQLSGLVIACGGGVVLNPDNINDYSRTGLVVCLTATPDVIMERTAHDRNRPLLEEQDRMKRILDLLEKRRHLYAAIPHQVDTSTLPSERVVETILEMIRS
jgi:dihydroorotase